MVSVKELTFMDLAVLEKIDADSVVERFGPKINASLFGAANVLGALKIKGYLDIQTSLGFSPIVLTDSGKQVLALADEKSKGDVDALDVAVLTQLGMGIKDPYKLEQELNIRSGDLAFKLYKLGKLGLLDYTIKSGTGSSPNPRIEVMLTEQGFSRTEQARGYAKSIAKVKEAKEAIEKEKVMGKLGEEEHENIAEELVSDEPAVMPAAEKTSAIPSEILEAPKPIITGVQKATAEKEELPSEPKGPVKIDRGMRMKARIGYYVQRYWKHAIAVFIILVALAAYAVYKYRGG